MTRRRYTREIFNVVKIPAVRQPEVTATAPLGRGAAAADQLPTAAASCARGPDDGSRAMSSEP